MAEDLKTLREVGIVLGELKPSIDSRFSTLTTHINDRFGVTDKVLYFLGAMIISGLAGGFAIYRDIGALHTEIAIIKNDIKSATEKLSQLSTISASQSAAITASQTAGQVTLARIEEKLSGALRQPDGAATVPLAIDDYERGLIRQFVAPNVKITGDSPVAKTGEVAPAAISLQALPAELVGKIPKLRGTRYALDENSGLVLIVSAADNKVLAVV